MNVLNNNNNNNHCDLLKCKLNDYTKPLIHLEQQHAITAFEYQETPMPTTSFGNQTFFELLTLLFPVRYNNVQAAKASVYQILQQQTELKLNTTTPNIADEIISNLDVIAREHDATFCIVIKTDNFDYFVKVCDGKHLKFFTIRPGPTFGAITVPTAVAHRIQDSVNDFKRVVMTKAGHFQYKHKSLESLMPKDEKLPEIKEEEADITTIITLVRDHLLPHCFPDVEQHIKIAIATSVASSIVTVTANISALLNGKLTSINKAVQVASIVTAMTSFTANVSLTLRTYGLKYDIQKVMRSLPSLASSLFSDQRANAAAWVYPTISCLVSIIIAGLTSFGVKEVKEVIQAGSLLKTLTLFNSEAKNIAKFILEDLLHLDITGDAVQHTKLMDLAKRSAELCVLPHYKFFGDPGLLTELNTISDRAFNLTSKAFTNPKSSQVARLAAQQLMHNCTILQEKELAIRTVYDTKPRQETFGVLLAGAPSIGKSYLLTHIWSKLSKLFGYKPDLYNLTISRPDGFFEPYGMQDCGFVNEFMGSREDSFLRHLNSVISQDPKNLEGAFQKSQPAQFKVVFLTSNDIAPELTRHLTQPAAQAVWNRIYRLQVEDPKCTGRQGVNSHRRSDFSHLTLKKVTNVEALGKEETLNSLETTDLGSVILEIAHQVARREKNYLSLIRNENIFSNEQVDITSRVRRLDEILATQNFSNSTGGNTYFIVRLQGEPDTGKTKLAGELAQMINSVYYKRDIVEITQPQQFDEPPSKEPRVYIIDDVLSDETHTRYFNWLNSCNPDSMFIIATNTIHKRYLRVQTKIKNKLLSLCGFHGEQEHYYIDTTKTHAGIARRIGLFGRVDAQSGQTYQTVVNNPETTFTVDATPGFQYTLNDSPITPEDLKNIIYRAYTVFLSKTDRMQVINGVYSNPVQDYDIKITADNLTSLYNAFSSVKNVTKLLFMGAEGTTITVSARVLAVIPRDMKDAKTLVPNKPLESRDDVISLAKRLGAFLCRLIPDIKIYFHLANDTPIVLVNKKLYIGLPIDIDLQINRDQNNFTWVLNGEIHKLSDEDFAYFVATGLLPPSMRELPQMVTAAIVAKYTAMRKEDKPLIRTYIEYFRIDSIINDYKQKGTLSFILDNKVLTLCAGILGIVTVTTLATKLYKLLNPPTNCANSFDDEYDPESSHYKDIVHLKSGYRNALLKGDKLAITNIQNQARQEGLLEKFNQWEHAFRSNSYLTREKHEIVALVRESIYNQDLDSLQFFIKVYPDIVKDILSGKANMLTIAETKHQMPTVPQMWISKLQKNYFLVTNSVTGAKVYALGIKDKTLMTVSHIFHQLGDECIVQSDGKQYRASCVGLYRSRDLAIVRVSDKTCPMIKDITNLFVSHQDFDKFSTAWFVRPTDKPLIYASSTKFRGRSSMVMTDTNNPLYQLNHDFWEFYLIGMRDLINTFSSGDCGLPLIAMYKNDWKIIGIHNSINGISSTGFFTSIALEDFTNISNSYTHKVPHIYDPEVGYVVDTDTHLALTNGQWEDSKYAGVSKLKIIGKNLKLHIHSAPKHKKKYVPICEPVLECETLPSAIDLTHVTDTSKLIPDKYGNFYPLFTQAVKYTIKTDSYQTWDTEIFDHVQESIKQYYDNHYGDVYNLKLRDVINGHDFVQALDMTTSAGPKMKRLYGVNTKVPTTGNPEVLFINANKEEPNKKPFYVINTTTAAGKTLMKDFHHYQAAIESGDPILVMIKDNAKVELLPASKVRQGKVRLFNEMDLSINMVLKSYFGGFLNSVISKHHECMYTIGFNPYKEATLHMLDFNLINGNVVSSDFSGLDKSYPKELIHSFIKAVSRGKWTEYTETALAKTLTYTYHNLNGHIYPVDCGNESGSYVTTLINCYAVHFVSWYTFTRVWKETYGMFPSLRDYEQNIAQRILGDDCIRKISNKVNINFEDLAEDAALFNLVMTPPKEQGEISFCSRVYRLIRPNIYAPCLKTESITSCLFYLANETTEQIRMNINVALFEASLHGEDYFKKIAKAALLLANHYNITIDLFPHKCYMDYFVAYVLCENKHPALQVTGDLLHQMIESNSHQSKLNLNQKFLKMADMWLNEYVQAQRLDSPVFTYSMDDKTNWYSDVLVKQDNQQYTAIGYGKTKKEAKREACSKVKAILTANETQTGYVRDGSVVKTLTPDHIEAVREKLKDLLNITNPDFELNLGTTNKANSDMPIEPATMNQASRYQGEGSLPANPNPQPTAVMPAMTSSGEDIQAAIMGQQEHTLNPIGAPDMSTVGAIQFDLKDLCYEQFLDADTEIEISADMPAGTVIAQIPYGWNHAYLNTYAKKWIQQHERYTGSFKYRYTVIGNPLFSGAIGIAWVKRRIETSIVPVSTMQKYSYSAKGVTMPWNVVHTLHDARKQFFYREVSDDLDDTNMADRPHLVLFLLMSLQNPLQPGVITRVRIASRLATVGEGNPFRALDPADEVQPIQQTIPISQSRLQTIFPQDLNKRLWLYTDGQLQASSLPVMTEYYPDMDFAARKNGIIGGTYGFSDAPTFWNVENWSRTDNENLLKNDWPWIEGKSAGPTNNVSVWITTVTNMDQKSFYKWFDTPEWLGLSNKKPTVGATNMTYNRWLQNRGFIPHPDQTGFKTHSITYNATDLEFSRNVTSVSIGLEAGLVSHIKEWIKVVTERGTIFILLCYNRQIYPTTMPSPLAANQVRAATGFFQVGNTDQMPLYPILNIDENLGGVQPDALTLPAGYRLLRITEVPPSAITIAQALMPTSNDNAIVAKYFKRLAEGLTTLECLQFRLIDAQSVRTIATVRYLQESGVFVIFAPTSLTKYAVIPQNNENIIIGQISPVPRATDFQETNISEWVDRTAPVFLRSSNYFKDNLFRDMTPVEKGFTSNASMALSLLGGGMSGIGSAITESQNKQHDMKMQQNQFSHNETMQGNMFDFQQGQQGRGFNFMKMMQENMFGFQEKSQTRNFEHDKNMLSLSHEQTRQTNLANTQNRLLERGLSSRVMSLPGVVTASSRA